MAQVAVVTGGRDSGKTERGLRWLIEAPEKRRVVVRSHPARLAAMKLLEELREPGRAPAFWAARILVPDEVEYLSRGHGPLQFWVDDAEGVLADLLGLAKISSELAGLAVTGEPPGPPEARPTVAHYLPAPPSPQAQQYGAVLAREQAGQP